MKKLTILILLIGIAGNVLGGVYGGGNGTEEEPYLISDPNHMQEIGANVGDWNSHFLLTNDIDLSRFSGTEFNIIGNDANAFTGVFDGGDNSILNFTYSTSGNYIGLFGYVDNPYTKIENLGLVNVNVDGGHGLGIGWYVASLVGSLENGNISGCYVKSGTVHGYYKGGGLVGNNRAGIIWNCYVDCIISPGGNAHVGGLVGHNEGFISNCYASGSIQSNQNVGGLVGRNTGSIFNCYANNTIWGAYTVGGLVGMNSNGLVSNCYACGIVDGIDGTGGLTGSNFGTISNSFWDTQTSNQSTSAGGTGKTTTELKQKSTFTNWDFIETWGIEDNQTYPFLKLTYPVGDLDLSKDVNLVDLSIFALHWLDNYN